MTIKDNLIHDDNDVRIQQQRQNIHVDIIIFLNKWEKKIDYHLL